MRSQCLVHVWLWQSLVLSVRGFLPSRRTTGVPTRMLRMEPHSAATVSSVLVDTAVVHQQTLPALAVALTPVGSAAIAFGTAGLALYLQSSVQTMSLQESKQEFQRILDQQQSQTDQLKTKSRNLTLFGLLLASSAVLTANVNNGDTYSSSTAAAPTRSMEQVVAAARLDPLTSRIGGPQQTYNNLSRNAVLNGRTTPAGTTQTAAAAVDKTGGINGEFLPPPYSRLQDILLDRQQSLQLSLMDWETDTTMDETTENSSPTLPKESQNEQTTRRKQTTVTTQTLAQEQPLATRTSSMQERLLAKLAENAPPMTSTMVAQDTESIAESAEMASMPVQEQEQQQQQANELEPAAFPPTSIPPETVDKSSSTTTTTQLNPLAQLSEKILDKLDEGMEKVEAMTNKETFAMPSPTESIGSTTVIPNPANVAPAENAAANDGVTATDPSVNSQVPNSIPDSANGAQVQDSPFSMDEQAVSPPVEAARDAIPKPAAQSNPLAQLSEKIMDKIDEGMEKAEALTNKEFSTATSPKDSESSVEALNRPTPNTIDTSSTESLQPTPSLDSEIDSSAILSPEGKALSSFASEGNAPSSVSSESASAASPKVIESESVQKTTKPDATETKSPFVVPIEKSLDVEKSANVSPLTTAEKASLSVEKAPVREELSKEKVLEQAKEMIAEKKANEPSSPSLMAKELRNNSPETRTSPSLSEETVPMIPEPLKSNRLSTVEQTESSSLQSQQNQAVQSKPTEPASVTVPPAEKMATALNPSVPPSSENAQGSEMERQVSPPGSAPVESLGGKENQKTSIDQKVGARERVDSRRSQPDPLASTQEQLMEKLHFNPFTLPDAAVSEADLLSAEQAELMKKLQYALPSEFPPTVTPSEFEQQDGDMSSMQKKMLEKLQAAPIPGSVVEMTSSGSQKLSDFGKSIDWEKIQQQSSDAIQSVQAVAKKVKESTQGVAVTTKIEELTEKAEVKLESIMKEAIENPTEAVGKPEVLALLLAGGLGSAAVAKTAFDTGMAIKSVISGVVGEDDGDERQAQTSNVPDGESRTPPMTNLSSQSKIPSKDKGSQTLSPQVNGVTDVKGSDRAQTDSDSQKSRYVAPSTNINQPRPESSANKLSDVPQAWNPQQTDRSNQNGPPQNTNPFGVPKPPSTPDNMKTGKSNQNGNSPFGAWAPPTAGQPNGSQAADTRKPGPNPFGSFPPNSNGNTDKGQADKMGEGPPTAGRPSGLQAADTSKAGPNPFGSFAPTSNGNVDKGRAVQKAGGPPTAGRPSVFPPSSNGKTGQEQADQKAGGPPPAGRPSGLQSPDIKQTGPNPFGSFAPTSSGNTDKGQADKKAGDPPTAMRPGGLQAADTKKAGPNPFGSFAATSNGNTDKGQADNKPGGPPTAGLSSGSQAADTKSAGPNPFGSFTPASNGNTGRGQVDQKAGGPPTAGRPSGSQADTKKASPNPFGSFTPSSNGSADKGRADNKDGGPPTAGLPSGLQAAGTKKASPNPFGSFPPASNGSADKGQADQKAGGPPTARQPSGLQADAKMAGPSRFGSFGPKSNGNTDKVQADKQDVASPPISSTETTPARLENPPPSTPFIAPNPVQVKTFRGASDASGSRRVQPLDNFSKLENEFELSRDDKVSSLSDDMIWDEIVSNKNRIPDSDEVFGESKDSGSPDGWWD